MIVTYDFLIDGKSSFSFTVDTKRQYNKSSVQGTAWTRLEYHQCPNCPLRKSNFEHCPVAIDIREIAEKFADIVSYQKVRVIVTTPERSYFKDCDAQTGLLSLLGLVMATSVCPILSEFKGMAEYHLPFPSFEETVFRTVGAYLLKQYYTLHNGETPDFQLKGLEEFYEEVGIVNAELKKRINSASKEDSNINAVNSLFAISALVSMSLQDQIDQMRPLFTKNERPE